MTPSLDYRALFECSPGLYLVLDPSFTIVAATDSYLAATMTAREQITGKNLFEVFPDNLDDPEATGTRNLRASLETVLRTGRPHTMRIQRYDIRSPEERGGGFVERFWSPVNTPVLVDGRLTYIIHRVEDVTDFVKQQQRDEDVRIELYLRTKELEEAKLAGFVGPGGARGLVPRANLYALLMQAPAAVCIVQGPEYIVELANPVFLRLAGRSVAGCSMKEVLDELPFLAPVSRVFEDGEAVFSPEVKLERRADDGSPSDVVFSIVYQPMRDAEGTVEGVVLLGFDITEQVEARRQLESVAEHLRQIDDAKNEFIATISHELRTPMTSILGWARMLAVGDLDSETHRSALEAIERSTVTQAKLIEDLLDDSRIAAGMLRLDLRVVDLRTVVESAVTSMRPAAQAKRIAIGLQAHEGRYDVAGDPMRLQQVVGNILGNAIKFTPERGELAVTLRRDDDSVAVEIKDNGRGLEPELLPHVFDRYRQGSWQTPDRQSGLGLGLAIAQQLVKMHGGTIFATSDGIGRGTTFTIRLPVHLASAATDSFISRDKISRSAQLPRLDHTRVVVVEDEIDNRNVLTAMIMACGGEVRSAGTGAEGFDLIATWKPHVIVSDIALPDIDGCSLLERIRSSEDGRSTPALALTVLGRPDEHARILAAGFDGFRQKPIDPVDLAYEVARLARSAQVVNGR